MGLQPAESEANFCWFALDGGLSGGTAAGQEELQRAAEIESETLLGLAQHGVLVRAGGALGRAGWLRVTYGTGEENARFLDALAQVRGLPGASADRPGRSG